jgi:hypothetical protein
MCGGGYAPPDPMPSHPGAVPLSFGRRPGDNGGEILGGAEPPPHIRRQSRKAEFPKEFIILTINSQACARISFSSKLDGERTDEFAGSSVLEKKAVLGARIGVLK